MVIRTGTVTYRIYDTFDIPFCLQHPLSYTPRTVQDGLLSKAVKGAEL